MLQHLLIIGTVFPEPASSAAGSRMMQLIALFRSQQWKITFASAASDSEFMTDLELAGVEKARIELNSGSFDSFIKELDPSIVMFDRFMTEEQFGWRVAEHCPGALRMLDTEDLHSLRAARQKALKENRGFKFADLLQEDVAKREAASILRSDLSLIISRVEMDVLQDHFKIDAALLHYVPFLLDPIAEEQVNSWKSFEERQHFISIGNFLHEPNKDAVGYLKEVIWPLIREKLPEAELHVYGAYPSQQVKEWHKPAEGFHLKGRAADAKEVIGAAKVMLAPLRFGAGLKGKLAEAMECGTPSVTTTIGAEAMHSDLDWNGVVEDDAKNIAAAAVNLYTDEALWKEAQRNGIMVINNLYSASTHGAHLLERIAFLQNNLEQHRKQNFIGAVLQHQTLMSTKYMAKWIEEKNK